MSDLKAYTRSGLLSDFVIKGYYSLKKGRRTVPAEVNADEIDFWATAFHEEIHSQIFQTTAYGLFQSYLAQAAGRDKEITTLSKISRLHSVTFDASFLAHEGIATFAGASVIRTYQGEKATQEYVLRRGEDYVIGFKLYDSIARMIIPASSFDNSELVMQLIAQICFDTSVFLHFPFISDIDVAEFEQWVSTDGPHARLLQLESALKMDSGLGPRIWDSIVGHPAISGASELTRTDIEKHIWAREDLSPLLRQTLSQLVKFKVHYLTQDATLKAFEEYVTSNRAHIGGFSLEDNKINFQESIFLESLNFDIIPTDKANPKDLVMIDKNFVGSWNYAQWVYALVQLRPEKSRIELGKMHSCGQPVIWIHPCYVLQTGQPIYDPHFYGLQFQIEHLNETIDSIPRVMFAIDIGAMNYEDLQLFSAFQALYFLNPTGFAPLTIGWLRVLRDRERLDCITISDSRIESICLRFPDRAGTFISPFKSGHYGSYYSYILAEELGIASARKDVSPSETSMKYFRKEMGNIIRANEHACMFGF